MHHFEDKISIVIYIYVSQYCLLDCLVPPAARSEVVSSSTDHGQSVQRDEGAVQGTAWGDFHRRADCNQSSATGPLRPPEGGANQGSNGHMTCVLVTWHD